MTEGQKLQWLNNITQHIYKTTLDPQALKNEVFSRLQDFYHLSTASALNHDLLDKSSVVFSFAGGFDEQSLRDYEAYYGKKTLAVNNQHLYQTANVFSERCLPNHQEYIASETYHDFFKKYNSQHMLVLVSQRVGNTAQYIPLRRGADAGYFTEEDIQLARHLVPHFTQASIISGQLQGQLNSQLAFEHAFNKMRLGIILLKNKKVAFVNHSANQLLNQQDGLNIKQNTLLATKAHDNNVLQQAISIAFEQQEGPRQAIVAFSIQRTHAKRPYQINIAPLHESTILLNQTDHYVMITITDPEHQTIRDARILIELYDLTQKEALVVQGICNGLKVSEVALLLDAKDNSIRFHLKNIFQKLNVTSQSELVSFILKGPVSFD